MMDQSCSAASPLFHCSQCSRSYKRQEHLQRHVAVHRTVRDHICSGCGAAFQRSDVLHRHAKTCDGRHPIRASRTRRACDACVRSKRGCSAGNPPCISCRKRGVACTFTVASTSEPSRSARDETSHSANIDLTSAAVPPTIMNISTSENDFVDGEAWSQFLCPSLPNVTVDDLDWTILEGFDATEETSLRFLESFTRDTGFLDSFDCLTAEGRSLAYAAFESRLRLEQAPDSENLMLKSREIITLIKEAVQVKPRNSPVTLTWSPVLETMCMEFFAPQHISLWMDLYWAIWHPNVNYMHRPTFEARDSKPALIGAMCIIGALVSPNESDRDNARLWMSSVEEVVFRDDDVCHYGELSTSFPTRGRLQAMQAMYMVCLYQNWEGDEGSKSRIRRFRYSTLVAVARDTGIHHARHQTYDLLQPLDVFWHDFVAREQLIRVFLWVFLLDTAFVIFNNGPPRMAIKEMKMHLACNEACFQAPTSGLCFHYLRMSTVNGNYMLSSLTAAMCRGPIAAKTQATLADIGPLNLFALTSALHSVIFQTQQAFGFETILNPVRVALENWSAIWRVYSTSFATTTKHCPSFNAELFPHSMWQRIGFMRFAPEYCLLARLIIDRITERSQDIESPEAANKAKISVDDDNASSPPILDRYDETSMRQVNDLITDFQRVVL